MALLDLLPWRKGAPAIEAKSGDAIQSSKDLAAALGWFFGWSSETSAGVSVTPQNAMRQATVYACVRVLKESVAQLPLTLYRREGVRSRIPAVDHPLYDVMRAKPNSWMTSYDLREMQVDHINYRGNAYAYINRTLSGVKELIPLHPDYMTVQQLPDYTITYRYAPQRGESVTLQQDEVLHLRGATRNGWYGSTPISDGAETIGVAIAARRMGAALFKNGMLPLTVLEHPQTLSEDAQARLKKQIDEEFRGSDKAFRTFLLEEGMKLQKLGLTPADTQMLETLKFSRAEICSLFRVPPHMVMDLERSTNNNIEQQSLEFLIFGLLPWLVRLEQAYNTQLLTAEERKTYYFKHDFNGLLRGDATTRRNFYVGMIQIGVLSPNEVRGLEDLDPREGGDIYLTPVNMVATPPVPGQPSNDQNQK